MRKAEIQLPLFGPEDLPRVRPPRTVMSVIDAAQDFAGTDIARFKCRTCGHETGWGDGKPGDGRPCPECGGEGDGNDGG